MSEVLGVTAALGQLAAQPGEIGPQAIEAARIGFADAVGTLLLGASEPVVSALSSIVLEGSQAGEASVLLGSGRARADDAALINATAAHAWALDDVAWGCHPSALLMPALLAQGESQHASGVAVLRAQVVGCEVLAELAGREPDPIHRTGWQPAGLLGPVAVAAAVASLMGLDPARAAHAIGIAASLGGGLVANFGTPTKAVHAGRASASGLFAARMAARGVTANLDVLERDNGFLRTLSPSGRVDTAPGLRVRPGRWRIVDQGLCLKRHPVCYSLHRVVDASIDLGTLAGFDAARVLDIEITLGETQAWMAPHHRPGTPMQARYSVEFAVVSGLLARAAGFDQLKADFIGSSEVKRLIERCRLALLSDRSEDDPVFAPADRVRVRLDDGTVLDSGDVAFAKGHARRPLSRSEREAKFRECARSALDDPDAVLAVLDGLDGLSDIGLLAETARQAGRQACR